MNPIINISDMATETPKRTPLPAPSAPSAAPATPATPPPLLEDAVLVVDKPPGWTSHDVVERVKRRTGARKVGHLGTLDPMATGVLPLVLNRSTRLSRFLGAGPKSYSAAMKLGEDTDTCDSCGKVVRSTPLNGVTAERVAEVLSGFKGRQKQVPPMYSAIKVSGTPLYKLARKGVLVEREPREVEVHSINVESVSLPSVEFSLVCSRGTYVRSICADAGTSLGCGAHMSALRRTVSGAFTIEEAVSPDAPLSTLKSALIPLKRALERSSVFFKAVEVDAVEAREIEAAKAAGAPLSGERWERFFSFLEASEVVRFTHSGSLLAIAECAHGGALRRCFRLIGGPS